MQGMKTLVLIDVFKSIKPPPPPKPKIEGYTTIFIPKQLKAELDESKKNGMSYGDVISSLLVCKKKLDEYEKPLTFIPYY